MKKIKNIILLFLFSFMTPFVNIMAITRVGCGNITGIPEKIPQLTTLAFTILEVAVPVLLVVMGSIDLFKGITANKEDEMKKGQQMFIKRLIVAAVIFFSVAIVKFIVTFVDGNTGGAGKISNCIDCFIADYNKCKKE